MTDNFQRTQELLAQEGLESIGQKLYNTINIDLSGDPKSARRWIWELLQNAKDVIRENGNIEINLTDNRVEFSHNGSPFLHNHLLAILSQRSTKSPSYTDDEKQTFFDKMFGNEGIEEDEARKFLNTSGKFGTGFMTTYLLSRKITLKSIYSTNGTIKTFSISLDREAETPDQMKEKVKRSFSSFTELEQNHLPEDIIHDYQEGSKCYTKFIYEFDSDGKQVAEHGLADLHNSIPFTLSFVDKINYLKIVEFGKVTSYKRLQSLPVGNITIVRIEKTTTDSNSIIEIAKLSDKYEALTIAAPIEKAANDNYKLIFPNKLTPRQFISFPLVGSESFSFPVIINSPLFNPDDSRSHVFLNLTDSHQFNKKVNLNRALFEKSIALYKNLLKISSENNWENVFYLAKSELPVGVDEVWYKEKIQKEIRKEILDTEIVVTENIGKPIKPKDAKFPIYQSDKLNEFWDLCKYLLKDKIPCKADSEVWKSIIEANTVDWPEMDFDIDLEKLLHLIQNESTFSAFSKKYFENDDVAFDALNNIIRFTETENKELLNRKENALRIFPDQTQESTFVEKKELSRDVKIPEQLKDVLKKTGENWYEKLVRDEIIIFERDSKLTVKIASDRIKEKIEKYSQGKLKEEESLLLNDGLFELFGYCGKNQSKDFEYLFKVAKHIFNDKVNSTLIELEGVEDFDWKPFQLWAIKTVLRTISSFSNLKNLSLSLYNTNYPEIKDSYLPEEEEIRFKTDTFLNDLINYAIKFENNQYHLLSEFAIIPNQLNNLCLFNNNISNDDSIPKELKTIIKDFGYDCRENLLHEGVSLKLYDSKDLKWICGLLDDFAINEQSNDKLKQPLRELDKWISKQKGTITYWEDLFKSFYRKRSGIVLNTYGIEERNQFDEILKSGMSAEFADIVKSGTSVVTVKEIASLSNKMNLESALSVLNKFPELTSEKIERLLEIEELSKGWNPELKYKPDEENIRVNFENGWKGEAFVYKEMKKRGFEVKWLNLSDTPNDNSIIDFEGEQHFISDNGDKYDLIAKNKDGHNFYIQVKSTTTDISEADFIAIPISTREWKFVFETNTNESYYLARVFNVNSNNLELYFMKLEKSEEL
jgi:hypothetical protein